MRRFRQFISLMRLFTRHPGALPAFFRWKPFSITSYEMAKTLARRGVEPELVVDGGANIGQFARAMAGFFPEARIISIEAHPETAALLRRNLSPSARFSLHQTAVGNAEGTILFHPHAYDLASSVLAPVGHGERVGHPDPITVPVTRLDTLLADATLPGATLLKLDLQGYELEALRGAQKTLSQVRWVLLEVGFERQYEGEARFEEIFDFLRRNRFRLLCPLDILRGEAGEIIQMDVLFVRES